jgi:hypothetical protein
MSDQEVLEDWQIEEYEVILKKIGKLKQEIDSFDPERPYKFFLSLNKKYRDRMTEKVIFYQGLKEIIKDSDVLQLMKLETNRIVYFKGKWSDSGHPKFYYFSPWKLPFMTIPTNGAIGSEELSPKDFVYFLMSGIGFDE